MPRLIVPSSGGGTKLSRTVRVGGAEGVCSGVGDGVADFSGAGGGVAVGDSCANAVQADTKAIKIGTLTFLVILQK